METHPPSLSAQLAALRAAVPSGTVEGYWVLNSAIETIFAALLRIFSRLEQMVELWQAGLLRGGSGNSDSTIGGFPA